MWERSPGEVIEVRVERIAPTYSQVKLAAWQKEENRHFAGEDLPDAQVQPVLEPLKCRLITKGNGLLYWAASPCQRLLWDQLFKHPQFALIGQPVDASHLQGILHREQRLGLDFPKWVSGDYSAATDGLSLPANELCLEAFFQVFKPDSKERDNWRAALGGHRIQYPCKYAEQAEAAGKDLGAFRQANGQLMGSPLSFPVLCALNLAAYWLALEEHTGKGIDIFDLPVLINGDDILFRADDAFYAVWQKWITRVGFTLSLGKNYIHERLLTVNSKFWLFDPQHTLFREIGYLNVGLLIPECADTQRQNVQESPWTSRADWAIQTCMNPERTQRRIRHYYREELARSTANGLYNLHAHPHQGGLGVSSLGADVRWTGFQRAFAKWSHVERLSLEGKWVQWDDLKLASTGPRLIRLNPEKPCLPPPVEVRHLCWRQAFEPARETEEEWKELESPEPLAIECELPSNEKPLYRTRCPKLGAFHDWWKSRPSKFEGDLTSFTSIPRNDSAKHRPTDEHSVSKYYVRNGTTDRPPNDKGYVWVFGAGTWWKRWATAGVWSMKAIR